jgi:transmembrane sensor
MTPTKSLDFRLLLDYLTDDCTPDQRVQVERWAAGHPVRQTLLRNLLKLCNYVAQRAKPQLDVDALTHRVTHYAASTLERAEQGGVEKSGHAPPKSVVRGNAGQDAPFRSPALPSTWKRLPGKAGKINIARQTLIRASWSVLAGAVVGAVFLFVGWQSGAHRLSTTLAAHASTYTTGNGERATIKLPDGSTVSLNVASQLQVPSDFAAGNRVVRLRGEALFTVAHQGRTPFTVVAGSSTTRVLGTSFVVRHYATDTAAMVAVRTGKVMVGVPAMRPAVVTANEQIVASSHSLGHVRPGRAAVFNFAVGVLTLDEVPLPTAIAELDRWYDVDIRLGDAKVAEKWLIGDFAAGSVAELAELLEGSINVRVVRSGRVLTLYSR